MGWSFWRSIQSWSLKKTLNLFFYWKTVKMHSRKKQHSMYITAHWNYSWASEVVKFGRLHHHYVINGYYVAPFCWMTSRMTSRFDSVHSSRQDAPQLPTDVVALSQTGISRVSFGRSSRLTTYPGSVTYVNNHRPEEELAPEVGFRQLWLTSQIRAKL